PARARLLLPRLPVDPVRPRDGDRYDERRRGDRADEERPVPRRLRRGEDRRRGGDEVVRDGDRRRGGYRGRAVAVVARADVGHERAPGYAGDEQRADLVRPDRAERPP